MIYHYSDINKIRTGTGDKLGLAIQSVSTAIAGVLVGFLRSWRLALVVVAVSMGLVLPVFAVSAFVCMLFAYDSSIGLRKKNIHRGIFLSTAS